MIDVRIALCADLDVRGFIHRTIAEKAGMTDMSIWGVFRLRRKLNAGELCALCEAMGITMADFEKYWREYDKRQKEEGGDADGAND